MEDELQLVKLDEDFEFGFLLAQIVNFAASEPAEIESRSVQWPEACFGHKFKLEDSSAVEEDNFPNQILHEKTIIFDLDETLICAKSNNALQYL